jgi:DNA-directed RNA polymerase specialized sigma24 family protein
LWPLLVTITARKALNELKRQGRQKRSYVSEAALVDVGQAAGREPTPDFALRLAEAINSLVGALGDETLQTIAELKLAGYANDEIAAQLGVSPRTVQRKLQRVHQEWTALDEESGGRRRRL